MLQSGLWLQLARVKNVHQSWSNFRLSHKLLSLMEKRFPVDAFAEILAVDYLKSGHVIAVPTDTVYGLACDAMNSYAINKIYTIKGRCREKPLAMCFDDLANIKKIAYVSHLPHGLLDALLPGPVTLILTCVNNNINKLLTESGKIAVRVPDHLFVRNLSQQLGNPLALTSANLSNEPSAVEVSGFSSVWDKLEAVFDGGNLGPYRGGSTVVDLSLPKKYVLVRSGVACEKTVDILKGFGLEAR